MGGKWKGLVLWHLYDKGIVRNGEMLRLIPNITQKMLTQTLREMEAHDIVQRVIYEQVPPKVEYSLTVLGKEMTPILDMMINWGIQYATAKNITLDSKK